MRTIKPEIAIYPLPLSKIAPFFGLSARTLRRYANWFGPSSGQAIGSREQLERFVRGVRYCKLSSRGGRGSGERGWEYVQMENSFRKQDDRVDIEALDNYLETEIGLSKADTKKILKEIFEVIGEQAILAEGVKDIFEDANWSTWTL